MSSTPPDLTLSHLYAILILVAQRGPLLTTGDEMLNIVDNHWYGLLITKVYEDLRDENLSPEQGGNILAAIEFAQRVSGY